MISRGIQTFGIWETRGELRTQATMKQTRLQGWRQTTCLHNWRSRAQMPEFHESIGRIGSHVESARNANQRNSQIGSMRGGKVQKRARNMRRIGQE